MPKKFEWPWPQDNLSDGVVLLRRYTLDDAPALAAACQDPETLRFTSVPHPYSVDDAAEFITRSLQREDAQVWAVELCSDPGVFAASIDVRLVSVPGCSVEVGYHAAPWARGRGVVSRALNVVVADAFAHGVQRFVLKARPENAASRRVAEKNGFVREGVLRNAEPQREGGFADLVVYSKLPTD